jgi:type VI secretion system FHA domain protein
MQQLVLTALECAEPASPAGVRASFDHAGGSIGRGEACKLRLPDPYRHISREHAEVHWRDGGFVLTVVSKVNGVLVNDRSVDPGESVSLAHGDRIRIGECLLQAAMTAQAASAPAGDALAVLSDRRVAAPVGDFDSLDALLKDRAAGAPAPAAMDEAFAAKVPGAAVAGSRPVAAASTGLHDKVDPVGDWSPDDIDRILGVGAGAGLQGGTYGPADDDETTEADALMRSHDIDLPFQGVGMPAPAAAPLDDVFAALEAELAGAGALSPPVPAQPGVPPAPSPPTTGAVALAGGTNPVHVLAAALGLDKDALDDTRPQETIRLAGEMLKVALEGLHRMLEIRAQLKRELRIADRTVIVSRENNPLKHNTVHEALAYLADLRRHGNASFMDPLQSVEDAVWDLCAHEMAVMAGTRAALLASLRLFAPQTIERRIKRSGALDAVLPALHKSKLWEKFLEMYSALEREAEDHFDQLLNEEFAKAYSEQSRLLRRR